MIRKIAILCLLVPFALASLSAADGDKANRQRRRRRVAEVVEKVNSEQDLLRVYVGYARRQDDGTYVVKVAAVWGDLDKVIDKCSPEHYANWDGTFSVDGGMVDLVRKVRFEDRRGNEPAEGSGADKIVEETETQVVWLSGVVGAVDGLVFKATFDSLNSSATLEAGGVTVT
ncbi:MAG: hypothetical protein KAU28_11065, partial [Phycisphaerae bacterium]|nr:hypothetical protein [Phycisphaerae bacterium]